MPEEQKLTLTASALKDLLAEVLAEARKPYVDEAEVARKKTEHDALMVQAAERRRREQAKMDACQHKRRSPLGVLAYKIAWQQNSDHRFRGTCQICGEQFTPERTPEPRYRELLRESLDPTTAAYAIQL